MRMSRTTSALVSCRWLAGKLASNTNNIQVLDGSWHLPRLNRNSQQEYLQKHIPGALFFDIDECSDKSTTLDHMLPPPRQFENYVGKLGISNDTHVVVYDNNETFGLFSAPRVWWTFRVFGHEQVSVLNGGFPKWQSENLEVTTDIQHVAETSFKASFNLSLVKSLEELETNIAEHNKHFTVLESRRPGKFNGTSPERRPEIRPGHIRSSLNTPYYSVMDTDTGLMKSPDELRQIFEEAGVHLAKPLVTSCGTGITACMLALGAFTIGKEDVAVYDGSWLEWYQRAKPENMEKVPPHDLT